MAKAPVYEQPLNERMRSFLRLQRLFHRMQHHTERRSSWDTHTAVITLLEILSIATRWDIKSEVIKELERQHASLGQFRDLPKVDGGRLANLLASQQNLIKSLHDHSGNLGQALQNDFLSGVRQRASMSGDICSFDMPVYHHWLNVGYDQRHQLLMQWQTPFKLIAEGIDLALDTVRQSAHFCETEAAHGFYQQNLNPGKPLQLIRVSFLEPTDLFPEISAGKHRFTVRMLASPSMEQRPEQTQNNVTFLLACCSV